MKKIILLFIMAMSFGLNAQTVTEGPSWIEFNFDDGSKCRAYNCFEKYCFGDRIQITDNRGKKFRLKPAAFINPDTGAAFATVSEMCGYLDGVYSRICETGGGSGLTEDTNTTITAFDILGDVLTITDSDGNSFPVTIAHPVDVDVIVTDFTIVNDVATISLSDGNSFVANIVHPTIDGSETIVTTSGDVTIAGSGTIADPYIIGYVHVPSDGSETVINAGANVVVSGSGTVADPYVVAAIDTSYQLVDNGVDGYQLENQFGDVEGDLIPYFVDTNSELDTFTVLSQDSILITQTSAGTEIDRDTIRVSHPTYTDIDFASVATIYNTNASGDTVSVTTNYLASDNSLIASDTHVYLSASSFAETTGNITIQDEDGQQFIRDNNSDVTFPLHRSLHTVQDLIGGAAIGQSDSDSDETTLSSITTNHTGAVWSGTDLNVLISNNNTAFSGVSLNNNSDGWSVIGGGLFNTIFAGSGFAGQIGGTNLGASGRGVFQGGGNRVTVTGNYSGSIGGGGAPSAANSVNGVGSVSLGGITLSLDADMAIISGRRVISTANDSYTFGADVVNSGSQSITGGSLVNNSGVASIVVGGSLINTGDQALVFGGPSNNNAGDKTIVGGQNINIGGNGNKGAAFGEDHQVSAELFLTSGIGHNFGSSAGASVIIGGSGSSITGQLYNGIYNSRLSSIGAGLSGVSIIGANNIVAYAGFNDEVYMQNLTIGGANGTTTRIFTDNADAIAGGLNIGQTYSLQITAPSGNVAYVLSIVQ